MSKETVTLAELDQTVRDGWKAHVDAQKEKEISSGKKD